MCSSRAAGGEPLSVRAATLDELLSDDFEDAADGPGDDKLAARRLDAWCKASTDRDQSLFVRRLEKDGLTVDSARRRLTAARRVPTASAPSWLDDAEWVRAALCGDRDDDGAEPQRHPFEQLLTSLVVESQRRLWERLDAGARQRVSPRAAEDLATLLFDKLCPLCAPPLYERFTQSGCRYDLFIRDMKAGGFHRLLDDKPVLLRLIVALTQQWLTTTREFLIRLDADFDTVRRDLLAQRSVGQITGITGGFSDPHCGGRTVLCVEFDNGVRVMYKPKDLRVDLAWHAMVERLNRDSPIQLRAPRAIAREGYGWTEFIDHTPIVDEYCASDFFRRAGAWLVLLHCFAACDIHQENVIAVSDHPVPVDLETLLQADIAEKSGRQAESQAQSAAAKLIADSVAAVGLLPAFGRSADRSEYAVGGLASDWTGETHVIWEGLNSDAMRPVVGRQARPATNLPRLADREIGLHGHLEDFVAGFQAYANFLWAQVEARGADILLDGFAGLRVRKVIRPTQFYAMLVGRLSDDRTMDDGAAWSAQADFVARLTDWDADDDPMWPLHLAERTALLELNVPFFHMESDGNEIRDSGDVVVETTAMPGLQRARERLRKLDEREIAWQLDVIRQTASFVADPSSGAGGPRGLAGGGTADEAHAMAAAEADAIASEICQYATRRGAGAAWMGLGWFPGSDVSQLAVVGHDMYNGTPGIAMFLAAHAKVAHRAESAELALAAVACLRTQLRSRGSARAARLLGIGGTNGLGSTIYALTTMSVLLDDPDLLKDAHNAASLVTDDLIARDGQLDVVGGSAGAILSMLRLYAATGENEVLGRAQKCGDHLLTRDRVGASGRRSWPGPGRKSQPLNGMSHGAGGFAYALSSLAVTSGREEFAEAARECMEFERLNYDSDHGHWTDLQSEAPHWRSQWCHGAVGIGLARLGMIRRAVIEDGLTADVDKALQGAVQAWPGDVDTLCCGSLGSVELFREAGRVLCRSDLKYSASQRLSAVLQNRLVVGDYRWAGGARRFNVGLFRGLAGVGYACLRELDGSLPNILIWE